MWPKTVTLPSLCISNLDKNISRKIFSLFVCRNKDKTFFVFIFLIRKVSVNFKFIFNRVTFFKKIQFKNILRYNFCKKNNIFHLAYYQSYGRS